MNAKRGASSHLGLQVLYVHKCSAAEAESDGDDEVVSSSVQIVVADVPVMLLRWRDSLESFFFYCMDSIRRRWWVKSSCVEIVS